MKYVGLAGNLAFVLAVAACGGGKGGGTTTTPLPTDVKAEIVLELGELTIFEGDNPVAKIHADGKTEFAEPDNKWAPGPTLKQDGTIEHQGSAVAKVNADGTIMDVKSSSKLPFVVTTDKLTVTDGDKQMSIELGANGVITVIGEDSGKKAVRVEGATTPGQRKTALAFLAIMVGGGAGEREAPSTEPGPAAVPPAVTPPG